MIRHSAFCTLSSEIKCILYVLSNLDYHASSFYQPFLCTFVLFRNNSLSCIAGSTSTVTNLSNGTNDFTLGRPLPRSPFPLAYFRARLFEILGPSNVPLAKLVKCRGICLGNRKSQVISSNLLTRRLNGTCACVSPCVRACVRLLLSEQRRGNGIRPEVSWSDIRLL